MKTLRKSKRKMKTSKADLDKVLEGEPVEEPEIEGVLQLSLNLNLNLKLITESRRGVIGYVGKHAR